ncbi:response regulator transcription factor [Thermoactinomyces mirandus]|uniref:Response regulator transcription factor n=1 Tax=Thermoactinomyces mirandus TaxID=2756294 RepID=A0A7W1XSG1_9BACL|nr:response regulator transcription factor [Thermoactinomyces mirandus]MBA4602230.1 response regulator transcription factor [Thermoactinomyces mirandus]
MGADQVRILIIEDEINIARVLQLELEHEGYMAEIAGDGMDGLTRAIAGGWDLILLDIMLPALNGIEVLRRFRRQDQQTPVLLLTARDSIPDKVTGLDQGANDYITKPFEMVEVLARIRANLRYRKGSHEEDASRPLQVGDLYLDPKTRHVRRGEWDIRLTPREFDLLTYLMRHAGQVLEREQIIQEVWGFDFAGDTNIVDVYIRYLRQKIDKHVPAPMIHTVRGVGYTLREHVG